MELIEQMNIKMNEFIEEKKELESLIISCKKNPENIFIKGFEKRLLNFNNGHQFPYSLSKDFIKETRQKALSKIISNIKVTDVVYINGFYVGYIGGETFVKKKKPKFYNSYILENQNYIKELSKQINFLNKKKINNCIKNYTSYIGNEIEYQRKLYLKRLKEYKGYKKELNKLCLYLKSLGFNFTRE